MKNIVTSLLYGIAVSLIVVTSLFIYDYAVEESSNLYSSYNKIIENNDLGIITLFAILGSIVISTFLLYLKNEQYNALQQQEITNKKIRRSISVLFGVVFCVVVVLSVLATFGCGLGYDPICSIGPFYLATGLGLFLVSVILPAKLSKYSILYKLLSIMTFSSLILYLFIL